MEQQLTIVELEKGMKSCQQNMETATFGMGCFWGPEARFGSLPGILRTRVGFSGGTTPHPTYRKMGDHTETVQIDFDPALISYEEVLKQFWRNHYPNRDEYKGRQYISLLRYHNEGQAETINRVKKEMEAELGEGIETEIDAYTEFTLAEEHHQKYYLKRYPKALAQLEAVYPEPELLVDSAFAARLNGFVKGFGTRDGLRQEILGWPIEDASRKILAETFMSLKW
ncbi:peptide-methionine (S)-S-oxide reductase [Planomicrobium sp. HSC-17F08]|nr:peptide-methionine (S)-S-oxide reductase [Planomicrobium sp. HSC-17F08]